MIGDATMHPIPSIRNECAEDIPAVHAVVQSAFGRVDEARLVDALRRSGALVLSAVALLGGRVVGHIAFSPVTVHSANLVPSVLALAPVAVTPDFQRQGIGSALVRWALEECRRLGHGVVIVLGGPGYYQRFGFTPAAKFGIECPFPVPPETFMLLELSPDAAHGHRGIVRYRPEFESVSANAHAA